MSLLTVNEVGREIGAVTILEGVTVRVAAGERIGLVGPNGAGKTTFFNVIAGIYAPTEGQIELDGAVHDREAAAARDRARDEILAAHGIRTLRFENRLVFEEPEAVVAAIRAAFAERM